MGSPLCVHMARFCLHCDWKLNSDSANIYEHSWIPLGNKYVSDTAVVQPFQQELCSPYSFSDCNKPISLRLYDENLSSYFETFEILDNFIKNYSDQQVALLQPHCLDIPKFILADEMSKWEKSKKHILRKEEGKKRYFAKKKNRKFGKQIRYVSRKSTADTKRRMRGRFVKVGEEYDYDPRTDKIMTKI